MLGRHTTHTTQEVHPFSFLFVHLMVAVYHHGSLTFAEPVANGAVRVHGLRTRAEAQNTHGRGA